MSARIFSKDDLLRAFADAYERVIAAAEQVDSSSTHQEEWGPRDALAHLAGWEIMASVRIPAIVGGMAPLEFEDEDQNRVMNDAINAAFVTLTAGQSVAVVAETLRRAYTRTLAILATLDKRYFQPGEYVYERTLSAVEHCDEHIQEHMRSTNRDA